MEKRAGCFASNRIGEMGFKPSQPPMNPQHMMDCLTVLHDESIEKWNDLILKEKSLRVIEDFFAYMVPPVGIEPATNP